MFRNRSHLTIQQVRTLFDTYLDRLGDWDVEISDIKGLQLDSALSRIASSDFKIVHPLFMYGYKAPTMRYRNQPLQCVGLDIETNHETGEPKLLGFWHPDSQQYHYIFNPTLERFYQTVKGITDNSTMHFTAWGKLDLQAIMRLFDPTEAERERLSKGLSANIKNGKIIGSPPIMRQMRNGDLFYIAHYIDGRSLKLGILSGEYESTVWVFNCRQFYPGTIRQTANGLGKKWTDFDRSSHLVDWGKFVTNPAYKEVVLDSNQQDARIVSELLDNLQQRFFDVFKCYPALLVSTGSLTDAAAGKMLSENPEDYKSNSWKWLCYNVWDSPEIIAKCETLISECYSAGWVDQFALGYFSKVWSADISSAYPHKIQALPDLRYSILITGEKHLDRDIAAQIDKGRIVESAFIRGKVTIPTTLKFHPITVKTKHRENIRPTGTFYAAYTLEERRFCEKYGATFAEEQYFILALTERHTAPIATVSIRLSQMRDDLLAELATVKDKKSDRYRLLDGQQTLVKLVNNSFYGKMVQTTERVEDIGGEPVITGYVGGDRFNMLYGTLVTARTRVQLAETAMAIVSAGGTPLMCMTDALYWLGKKTMVPKASIRAKKTTGYFDPPKLVRDMYVLKTGQYEYRDDKGWSFKCRGLPIIWTQLSDAADDDANEDEMRRAKSAYFRPLIKAYCKQIPRYRHPKDIRIPVRTRRLITIGYRRLDRLASIRESTTELKPFVLSAKSVEKYVLNWIDCLDGYVTLATQHLTLTKPNPAAAYPLSFPTELFEAGIASEIQVTAAKTHRRKRRLKDWKRLFVAVAITLVSLPPPPGDSLNLTWRALDSYFGRNHTEILAEFGYKGEGIIGIN